MIKTILLVCLIIVNVGIIRAQESSVSLPGGNIKNRKSVAFLISDGTLPLDYIGAYEVFGQAGYKVFTIAKEIATIKLSSNLKVIPNYSISDSPDFNILVVPVSFHEGSVIASWIKEKAAKLDYILTVCSGVVPVYDAGLLDGKIITSYGPLIDHLKEYAVKSKVVTNKRFIDNGKVIVCGSYVSGIDGALYLISKIDGEPRAREVANNIEYNWDPTYSFVRAKLADNWLAPLLDFGPPLKGKTVLYQGDEKVWDAEYETTRAGQFNEFYSQIPEMAEMHKWKETGSRVSETEYYSTWKRVDLENNEMIVTINIKKLPEGENRYILQYHIEINK